MNYDIFELDNAKRCKDKESDTIEYIQLVPVPLVEPSEIQQLLTEEILTREEAVNMVRASLGMRQLDHVPPESKWLLEQRKLKV